MPKPFGAADSAALLFDGAADKYISIVQYPAGLPEDIADLALPARPSGLKRGEPDDVDLVILLFGPAFRIIVGFIVIAFQSTGFAVAEVLTATAQNLLADAVRGPFIGIVIPVLTEDFGAEISEERTCLFLAVSIIEIVQILRCLNCKCW